MAADIAAPVLPHQQPILRSAIEHFKPNDLNYTDVSAWKDEDGKPARIYYKPFTLEDKAWLARKAELDGAGVAAYADLIIRKALDENGNTLFSLAHRDLILKQVDPDILSALVGMITQTKSVSEHIKNFIATPNAG